MRVFISQPMKGKTAEEIITERERLIGKAREHYGADIEVIDSYIQHGVHSEHHALWQLGKSLELMSAADAAVFAQDWEGARGCRIENMAATLYGLEVLEVYSRGD